MSFKNPDKLKKTKNKNKNIVKKFAQKAKAEAKNTKVKSDEKS